MTTHRFHIPRLARYWRDSTPSESDLARLLGVAQRIYPDVAFELCDHPPRSQRYPRGSENERIRLTLERMSSLDLSRQFEHHLGFSPGTAPPAGESPTPDRVPLY
jgi:hypothetical protein